MWLDINTMMMDNTSLQSGGMGHGGLLSLEFYNAIQSKPSESQSLSPVSSTLHQIIARFHSSQDGWQFYWQMMFSFSTTSPSTSLPSRSRSSVSLGHWCTLMHVSYLVWCGLNQRAQKMMTRLRPCFTWSCCLCRHSAECGSLATLIGECSRTQTLARGQMGIYLPTARSIPMSWAGI